jgi:hypothetical protein
MKIDRRGDTVTIVLTGDELKLLRRALERASFIDTPVEEQAQIASFATRALDQLAAVA